MGLFFLFRILSNCYCLASTPTVTVWIVFCSWDYNLRELVILCMSDVCLVQAEVSLSSQIIKGHSVLLGVVTLSCAADPFKVGLPGPFDVTRYNTFINKRFN